MSISITPAAELSPPVTAGASTAASTPPRVEAVAQRISVEGIAQALAEQPTQRGPRGILFDFNDGCRIIVPEASDPWRVRMSDLDTGNILFETEVKSGAVRSVKRYFVRFRVEIWQRDEKIFGHDYCATDRDVLVRFPTDAVGDPIGWFPYAIRFKEQHDCRLTCTMNPQMVALLHASYPDITFATEPEVDPTRFYATYSIAVFYRDGVIYDYKDNVPCDFRHVGLHRAAGYILGVDPTEEPPRIDLPDNKRPIAEPYVCIAVQSTAQSKYWNNPTGWADIVSFLREAGYRVFCIDLKRTHGKDLIWNHMPPGAEDLTGDRPLIERAQWLKHAEFFIGLSSGLSWLAWAMRVPVVMISGVTHPLNEFATPYRVINYHVCNSCWNDPLAGFDRRDFLSCPRHKGTPRQFECTRLITTEQVKQVIRRIPNFGNIGHKPPTHSERLIVR
jgi:autotransporter strand-loop-strand O-heptosyltransferase